jgi:hypothetical protein
MMLATAITISPRPMGDVNSVMRDLDIDSDKVRALLDEGRLIGFNISARQTDRPHFRILTKSVEHYKQNGWKKPLVLEWPEIFRLVLPHDKLFVRGPELQRSLNCSPQQMVNLVRAGCFVSVKKMHPDRGGATIVTRGSFENFLIGRLQ